MQLQRCENGKFHPQNDKRPFLKSNCTALESVQRTCIHTFFEQIRTPVATRMKSEDLLYMSTQPFEGGVMSRVEFAIFQIREQCRGRRSRGAATALGNKSTSKMEQGHLQDDADADHLARLHVLPRPLASKTSSMLSS